VGLGGIHKLGIAGEPLPGVKNALDYIADYKSGKVTTAPRRVAVIGAGNTAIDAANAAVRLGAKDVHLIYRRGREQMSAFAFEYEHAKQEGVKFLWNTQPIGILGAEVVEALDLVTSESSTNGSPGENFQLSIDLVILAIGQSTHTDFLGDGQIGLERGHVLIDRITGQTTNPKYFAGGDCTNGGREVVDAVADGKRAGIGIAAWLEGRRANT
jgi:glutamate synthase (NADPH/NADH) small chain